MKLSKRIFDLSLTIPGVIILSPLFGAIALAIKLQDGGPVFFRQERIGYKGRPFRIWKFRTMIVDAEKHGKQITVEGDTRITRIGAFLRKTKLDELPQLFNVLTGQMSLVGPRPEVPHYVALYTEEQKAVLNHPPGITDPASMRYRNESDILLQSDDPEQYYVDRIMPEKIAINLQHAEKGSVVGDMIVIVNTLCVVIKR